MVNDCWKVVAVALLGPHWCYDDNTAVCWSQFTIHNPQHVIHLPSHTFITTQPDTFEWWNMLMDPLVYWLSLRSRIQTQHDLKSPVYQSFIVPLLLECLKYKLTREACPWVREIFEIYCLPSPMSARGVAIYKKAVWPQLLFSTSVSSAFTRCARLCQLPVSLPSAAMCSVSAVSWQGPPRNTTCLVIHWVK